MRNKFANLLIEKFSQRDDFVFLTGDLGFNALEGVREAMGNRFINAGVAEQNMVGVAAGLAYKGYKVIAYSIAPFAVYRCLEQIRVDVCLHDLPVFIVGNGGGYGYGIMGGTHHAIEDLACLSCLPNMNCYVPAYYNELEYCLDQMFTNGKPSYLRLGLGKENPFQSSEPMQLNALQILDNAEITVLALGPIAHNCKDAIDNSERKVDFFSALKMPILNLNEKFFKSITKTGKLVIAEEHSARGGLSENILLKLNEAGISNISLKAHYAKGYPNGLYGSQKYHQIVNGLDGSSILNSINTI